MASWISRYEPELVSRLRAFQLGPYFSYSLSQGVVLDVIETEVCRRGINKCRARSTFGKRSSQRRIFPESLPLDPLDIDEGRRAIKRECVFFSKCDLSKLSIANSTGRFASSLDRTDASDASTLENERSIGIVDESTWVTVHPIVVELVHACYRDTVGTDAHVTSSRVCLARVLHAVVNAVKDQQLQIQESVSICAIIAVIILSRCYKLRWFHGI